MRPSSGKRAHGLDSWRSSWTPQKRFPSSASQGLKVSVIVPNFRHARYLEERLGSIFDQTLRPHEIILLDDASPMKAGDRAGWPRCAVPMQIVVNEQNSGSTFRQWIKGLSLATGDLIWFAESDDSAHPLFSSGSRRISDPEVVLAYCQSALIGPTARNWLTTFVHTDDIPPYAGAAVISAGSAEEAELALSQKKRSPTQAPSFSPAPEARFRAEELVSSGSPATGSSTRC